jgi:hypothetical protein
MDGGCNAFVYKSRYPCLASIGCRGFRSGAEDSPVLVPVAPQVIPLTLDRHWRAADDLR